MRSPTQIRMCIMQILIKSLSERSQKYDCEKYHHKIRIAIRSISSVPQTTRISHMLPRDNPLRVVMKRKDILRRSKNLIRDRCSQSREDMRSTPLLVVVKTRDDR
ncbi:hypothetical protein Tco_0009790 [Tanacetum coccineum]